MNRKEEILDAVVKSFHKDGFKMDLTISQIAKLVDIGKSTLYEYFKNKDEIYTEAILLMINSNTESSLSIDNFEEMDFEESFKVQVTLLLNMAYQSRMMLEMFTKNFIYKLPDSIREGLKKTMESARLHITNRFILIFTKGIQEGILKQDIDPLKIEVITSMIVGSVVRYSDSTVKIDLNDFVKELYRSSVLISK